MGPSLFNTLGRVVGSAISGVTGVGRTDSGLTTPTIGYYSWGLMKELVKPNVYTSQEDLVKNSAIFFNVPYVWSGIIARSTYSLGRNFSVLVPESEEVKTKEEIWLDYQSMKFNFKNLFFKTGVHLDVYGNAYWYPYRNPDGSIRKIKIIQPERVGMKLDQFGNIERYVVNYPNYANKYGPNYNNYEIAPENMIHFTEREFLEIPMGISVMQPFLDLAESRFQLNTILPIIYQRYAKPFMHIQYTPDPNEPDLQVKEVIRAFKDAMNTKMEPDSDLVTNHKWRATAVSPPSIQNSQGFIDDLDRQIFSCLEIPEFFFKPRGTTDLNVSEASRHFLLRMKERQEHFAQQFISKFIIPELERKFKNNFTIPVLKFEQDVSEKEMLDRIQALLKNNLITNKSAQKMLNLPSEEVVDEEDTNANAKPPDTRTEGEA